MRYDLQSGGLKPPGPIARNTVRQIGHWGGAEVHGTANDADIERNNKRYRFMKGALKCKMTYEYSTCAHGIFWPPSVSKLAASQ